MRILVTGGAGFIGSHIVDGLLKEKHEVIVLDNFFTGKKDNITHVKNKIKIVEGDVRDIELLKKISKDVDAILHQAAMRSVPVSLANAPLFNEVNITGMYNILETARTNGIKRVIAASSSSVYGTIKTLPLKEEDAASALRTSPYAITKFSAEDYCNCFNYLYGIETASLRYFNVFGPRQDPTSQYATVIPKFILAINKEEQPTIYGHGDQRLDFTYVENIVNANILALTAKDIAGQAINVGNGKNTSVNEMFQKVCELLKKKTEPKKAPFRFKGEDRNTLADLTKAKKLLGYTSKISFEEGLKKTVKWFVGDKK